MTVYFAYGSNMNRADMAARCPCALALGVAKLTGWRFIIGDAGYASITPALGGQVIGVLWHLTPRGLAALNASESLDSGLYVRRQVMVRHDGEAKTAMVYVARKGGKGRPRSGYLELVVTAAREWALPAEYIRALQYWARNQRCVLGARLKVDA